MQTIYLLPTPNDKYYVEVVGESKTQKAIKDIVAYKIMVAKDDMEHHDQRLIAHLILEDDNKFDPGNAVRVDIDNRPVGYLSAVEAGRYRKALSKADLKDVVGVCRAAAHGKRQDEGQKMVYGIWLSFNLDKIEIAEETQVLHPKKKGCGLFTIPLFIALLFMVALACRSESTKDLSCVDIQVTSCDLDSFGGYVHGTAINNCKENFTSLKVISEVYSESGILLASDEEYIENIQAGQQQTFKAIMDTPASKGTSCRAKIDSGY